MAQGYEKNWGDGTFQNHGKIASPQGPCGHELPSNGASTNGGTDGGEPKGKVGAYKQTPGTVITMKTYDGTQPSPGTMPSGEQKLATPMDASLNGTSIGTPGNASGTGATGKGKISTPWGSGPFGESAG
jgi:hypothetical protein